MMLKLNISYQLPIEIEQKTTEVNAVHLWITRVERFIRFACPESSHSFGAASET